MADLTAIKEEFWGDLQADLFTANSAIYLADQKAENIIRTDGQKLHRPIISHPDTGKYEKYNDINFSQKEAEDQTLLVDTFVYSADELDITDKMQNPYDALQQSLTSIRKGLMNRVEQEYLANISDAFHTLSTSPITVSTSDDVLGMIEEANGKLGSFDVDTGSDSKALLIDPVTAAALRRAKAERATNLGDKTLENGVIGPWQGWTIVQNNNLPWSATLTIETNPTDGDTIKIAGITFTFKSEIANPGDVRIGATAADTRSNLKAAVEGGAGEGTDYIDMDLYYRMPFRRSRRVRCTTDEAMSFTGNGSIATSANLTAGTDGWSNEKVKGCFMKKGAIDLVLQFAEIKVGDKEKGFADLPKGIVGTGSKMFSDGAIMSVQFDIDASGFKA